MPSATPWPDDGDAAFLAALDSSSPKPKPLTGMIAALAGALRERERTVYVPKAVEARMCIESARRLASELGVDATDADLGEGATVMGLVLSIDSTIPDGEVVIWPTPDEWAITAFVNRAR